VGKDAVILAEAAILMGKAVLAHAVILVDTATLLTAATLADLADEPIPGGAATLASKHFPAVAAIPADEATTVGAIMTEDGAGATMTGIVAVVASVSGTTVRLTRMAPAITTRRTIAIPTATTINGAIGILQPRAATPTHTGIKVSR